MEALEAAAPEVFAGFPFALTSVPAAFPTASRPRLELLSIRQGPDHNRNANWSEP